MYSVNIPRSVGYRRELSRWWNVERHHDLLIMSERAASVDHEVGMFPWSICCHIGVLFSHPVGVGRGRDLTRRHPSRIPGLAYRLRCLHPDDHIQLRPHRFLTRPNALNDHEVTAIIDRDRTLPIPGHPRRR